jgi:hypothetical protein
MSESLFSFDIDFISQITDFCLHEIALEGLRGCKMTDIFDLFYKSSNSMLIPTQTNTDSDDSILLKINKFFSITNSYKSYPPSEKAYYRNFLWNLLVNQFDLDFFVEESEQPFPSQKTPIKKQKNNNYSTSLANSKKSNPKHSNIINDQGSRGFCSNYFKRKCVNSLVKPLSSENSKNHQPFSLAAMKSKSISRSKSYLDCLKEFSDNLTLVANQQQRNKVLCPSYKNLEFENVNDMEYCVLEEIARSRYQGLSSTGENGLTEIFDLVPKQLHYIICILESNQLVKKQSFSSEKKRSVIHLTRYAYKKRTVVEDVCEYLLIKHFREKKNAKTASADPMPYYFDTFTNIKQKLGIAAKKFKTTIVSAEKQNILKRDFINLEYRVKKNKNASVLKTRPVRIIKLTEAYFKTMLSDNTYTKLVSDTIATTADCGAANEDYEYSINEENTNSLHDLNETGSAANDDEFSSISAGSIRKFLGSKQSYLTPIFTQIFEIVEEHAENGISLKEIGILFGLGFYKSRRLGANLQAHPDIVTIIKETTRMRAKYQTIMLRKFLNPSETKKLLEPSPPPTPLTTTRKISM